MIDIKINIVKKMIFPCSVDINRRYDENTVKINNRRRYCIDAFPFPHSRVSNIENIILSIMKARVLFKNIYSMFHFCLISFTT